MEVYQTDHNGFYVGPTVADIDPLDTTNHLIPANCVTVQPPEIGLDQLAQWVNGAWVIVTQESEPALHDPEPIITAESIRHQRDILLAKTDWRFRSDMTPSQAWIDYCQALRDIPQQDGFPEGVIWPVEPAN